MSHGHGEQHHSPAPIARVGLEFQKADSLPGSFAFSSPEDLPRVARQQSATLPDTNLLYPDVSASNVRGTRVGRSLLTSSQVILLRRVVGHSPLCQDTTDEVSPGQSQPKETSPRAIPPPLSKSIKKNRAAAQKFSTTSTSLLAYLARHEIPSKEPDTRRRSCSEPILNSWDFEAFYYEDLERRNRERKAFSSTPDAFRLAVLQNRAVSSSEEQEEERAGDEFASEKDLHELSDRFSAEVRRNQKRASADLTEDGTIVRPRSLSTADRLVIDQQTGLILGGTVSNLVNQLANETETQDLDYVEDFLLTCHYFITTPELIASLKRRYLCPMANCPAAWLNIIQQRVVVVLNWLLQKHAFHFDGLEAEVQDLSEFIEKTITTDHLAGGLLLKALVEKYEARKIVAVEKEAVYSLQTWSKQHTSNGLIKQEAAVACLRLLCVGFKDSEIEQLLRHLVGRRNLKEKLVDDSVYYKIASRSQFSKLSEAMSIQYKSTATLDFFSIPVQELARQITLQEERLLRAVSPKDLATSGLASGSVTPRTARSGNPTDCSISRIVEWTNKFNSWVMSEILTSANLKKRTACLTRFITLAEECQKLRNYNTVVAVVFALTHNNVERLQKTWKGVPKKSLKSFGDLKELCSVTKNFAALRRELSICQAPFIPYFPLIQKDILVIEEVAPKELDPGVVNFARCRDIANVLKSLKRARSNAYSIRPAFEVLDWINKGLNPLQPERLYELSISLEPKHHDHV